MKRQYSLFLLLIATSVIFSCRNIKTDPKNPHGLDIINSYETYLESVEKDPDMELVDLEKFIPGIKLDIRYATSNNFTGVPIYTMAKAFLRKPAAEALKAIHEELSMRGLGLKIFDAYRPYAGTLYFYEVYHDTTFVASPLTGSNHNKGFAVDLTLINAETGEELQMPTEFDSFTKEAAIDYADLPDNVITNRKILIDVMTSHGFTTYKDEWWHFNYAKEREKYKIMDIPFEDFK